MGEPTTCATDTEPCTDPIQARGLCRRHYLRAKRAGTLPPSPRKEPKQQCDAVDDGERCPNLRTGQQLLCNKHYQRLIRNGDLERRKPGPEGGALPKCARCDRAFKFRNSQQRRMHAEGKPVYCTPECFDGATNVDVTCAHCGKVSSRRKKTIPPSGVTYCSAECRDAAPARQPKRETRTCEREGCDETFEARPASTKRFHSIACKDEWQKRNRRTVECQTCGNEMELRPSETEQFCSRACFHEARRAKVGDRYIDPTKGYAWVWIDDGAGGTKKVQEHRHVMEQHLGRSLYSWETVHHRFDGFQGRSDNRLQNLEHWAKRHPYGHKVEDITLYCREMLSLYGDDQERERYAPFLENLAKERASLYGQEEAGERPAPAPQETR